MSAFSLMMVELLGLQKLSWWSCIRHLIYIGRIDVEVLNEIKGCRQFLGVHLPFRLGVVLLGMNVE